MAINPEIQKKLQNEIDEVLNENDNKLTYQSIIDMKYLEQVIMGKTSGSNKKFYRNLNNFSIFFTDRNSAKISTPDIARKNVHDGL